MRETNGGTSELHRRHVASAGRSSKKLNSYGDGTARSRGQRSGRNASKFTSLAQLNAAIDFRRRLEEENLQLRASAVDLALEVLALRHGEYP